MADVKKPSKWADLPVEKGLEDSGLFDVVGPYKKAILKKLKEEGAPEAMVEILDLLGPESPTDLLPTSKLSKLPKSDMIKELRFPKIFKKDQPLESQVMVTGVSNKDTPKKLDIMEAKAASPEASTVNKQVEEPSPLLKETAASPGMKSRIQKALDNPARYQSDLATRLLQYRGHNPILARQNINMSSGLSASGMRLDNPKILNKDNTLVEGHTALTKNLALTKAVPDAKQVDGKYVNPQKSTALHEGSHLNLQEAGKLLAPRLNKNLGTNLSGDDVHDLLNKSLHTDMVKDRAIKLGEESIDPITNFIKRVYKDTDYAEKAAATELIPMTVSYLTNKAHRKAVQNELKAQARDYARKERPDLRGTKIGEWADTVVKEYDNKVKASYKKAIDRLNSMDEDQLEAVIKQQLSSESLVPTSLATTAASKGGK